MLFNFGAFRIFILELIFAKNKLKEHQLHNNLIKVDIIVVIFNEKLFFFHKFVS